ncbi:formate dehydrogenase subunit gamma [Chelatococcus sp. GCM10030263]|uniref:formate dehydrogenase subunit gamma n=1 Tax=Chelatococcus sp. GCM10030263 TaxID=3273387 RepID=UPI00361D0E0D
MPEASAPYGADNAEVLGRDVDREVRTIAERFKDLDGATLPLLHAVQEAFGHVPRGAVPIIAEVLNRSRAEIHGVVTFYHDFRAEPAGRHVVKVCQAEACQSMGSDRVARAFEEACGTLIGETAADGSVTLEPVYCLGLCACAPSAMVDGRVVGRLDEDGVRAIVRELA